jgi:hypothetical protein
MDKIEIQEIIEKGGLVCRTVCELVGSPKEHIDKTIRLMVDKAKVLKDTTLLEQEIAESVPRGNMFSTFTEMTLVFKTKEALLGFCFDFMPSSVEVIEPEKMEIENNLFSSWVNELQGRLHQIDMVAKEKVALARVYDKQQQSIIRYNLLSHLIDEPLSEEDLRKRVGIDKETFKNYLDTILKNGDILKEEDKLKLSEKVKFEDVSEKQS